jgi:hypothetical protein
MNFFERLGIQDPFTPSVAVRSILLSNIYEQNIVPGSTNNSVITSNNITVNFNLTNRKYNLLPILKNPDIANYTDINFIAFQNQKQFDSFMDLVNRKLYTSYTIPELASLVNNNIVTKTVKLTEIPSTKLASELQQIDLNNNSRVSNFFEYSTVLDNLDPNQDIILAIISTIDFKSYFRNNKITTSFFLENSIKEIYNLEILKYNILIKNEVIEQQNSIVTDLRQINELNNVYSNFLTDISSNISTSNIEQKPSYISDIFTSYDYQNNIIRNYFFFDIKKFLINNCTFSNLYNAHTIEQIENVLNQNNCIYFNINKNLLNSQQQVCSFNTSYQGVRSGKYINASLISELTTNDTICISFYEPMPKSIKQTFNYVINVSYNEQFLKQYYNPSNSGNTGIYFNAIKYVEDIRKYVTSTANIAKSGRFTNLQKAPFNSLNLLIDNLFLLYNLFSSRPISNSTKNKIRNSLNFQTSTKLAFDQFLKFADNMLAKMNSLFLSYKAKNTKYIKTGNNNSFANKSFYFLADTFSKSLNNPKATTDIIQNKTFKYFAERKKETNTLFTIKPTEINEANPITYKIINSSLNLKNQQISYSPDISNISMIAEGMSMTVKKVALNELSSEDQLVQTSKLFSQSSVDKIASLQTPATYPTDSDKETASLIAKDKNANINNKIKSIAISNQVDGLDNIIFNFTYRNSMNSAFLVPQYIIQIYDFKKRAWTEVPTNSTNTKTNSYLARTIYKESNNIYNRNNVVPPIGNQYFVIDI